MRLGASVTVVEMESGRALTVTIALPPDAASTPGTISVLTSLARALLGARVGDTVEWTSEKGLQRGRIERIDAPPDDAR